ncbi:MAG: undecaprenyldiphospho-muramoylpentapeptide beta-N-acetylglucosaminyltransferase [Erysipelotrichaceae bacterium]|nr:undecaprenyldiphospho-muramoylpentapeptide beta-N-acetylglucosaminyltransferase [Erysipelotrichaceae bacterium]
MRILITTGGTGGHIYPAVALADLIRKNEPDSAVLFIGNNDRMESREIPARGYDFFGIDAKGFNGNSGDKLKSVSLMSKSYGICRRKIKEFRPDIIVGFGGYVTVPVVMAGRRLNIPVVIHEQNSIPGMANRFLQRFAKKIVTCYPEANPYFPEKKTCLLGNPRASVAKTVEKNREVLCQYGLQPEKKTIFVVMGSLGSSSINDIMKKTLQSLQDPEIQVIYVTGRDGYDEFIKDLNVSDTIRILPYCDQPTLVANTDLTMSRGGATSAAEITALKVPSIIVPSPYVPNNHQFLNAKAMLDAGCAYLLEEKDMSAETVLSLWDKLIHDEETLASMALKCASLGFENAAEDILALLHEVIGESV